jgi:phosphoglycolate phosphatase
MSYSRYPAVLFDLDGTLTDPYVGITTTFRHTLTLMGFPPPDDETMRTWIGPPLQDTLRIYMGDAALVPQAVAIYRARYREFGMYENRVYAGIPELLGAAREAGAKLYVATSKLITPALGILEHFGLAPFFDGIIGSTPDERISTKDQVVAATLELLTPVERAGCVMVGDTAYDIEGARANAVPCIAVSYGYGSLASLEAAKPLALAHTVDELGALLLNTSG